MATFDIDEKFRSDIRRRFLERRSSLTIENAATVKVIILCGRSGVGKTTVANEISAQLARLQVEHVHIEGDNLDQKFPEEASSELMLANLGSMWRNYVQMRGCRTLLLTGTAMGMEVDGIEDAVHLASGTEPSVGLMLFVLNASDDTVRRRLERRELGSTLQEHLESSAMMARELDALEGSKPWIKFINTNGKSIIQVADEIMRSFRGWLIRESAPYHDSM